MFILDSLMIAGIRWALETAVTAAEAEMNDDAALREQLLEAEMRREMGEISDEEFQDIEADLLTRIREIKERREGSGPLAFGEVEPIETTGDNTFSVEATVSGDFHDPAQAPHATVVESSPNSGQAVMVMDIEPGDAAPPAPAPPESVAGPLRGAQRRVRATATTRRATKTRPRAASAPTRKRARRAPGKARTSRRS